MAKTFDQKLAERQALGEKTDALDEQIVEEFLSEASPTIARLRSIQEKMSDNLTFTASAKRVLQQVDGLLRDPLAMKVVAKMRADAEGKAAPAKNEPDPEAGNAAAKK